MDADLSIAAITALVGKRARARILTSQMDGRAHAAKELGYSAGVTPQTASSGHGRATGIHYGPPLVFKDQAGGCAVRKDAPVGVGQPTFSSTNAPSTVDDTAFGSN